MSYNFIMVKKKHLIKPTKEINLLQKIRDAIDNHNFKDMTHASERAIERRITRAEYLYVLKNGYHEKNKDKFEELYSSWNYSIRGKTLDKRELRVIVSFDENDMLIITVIDLELE